MKIIAFYLPQFHPFKENDEWWGKGFTEWTNVGKARKIYPGHYQPRVPADLGYYDLRLPEVREQQAQMAKDYGISAFCYYHYWFGNDKQLMEKPLEEVIRLQKPDFPFCLCWANHSWENKNWNPSALKMKSKLLIEQKYPGLEDSEKMFYTLLSAFKDKRYLKVNNQLVYMIYRADSLPYYKEFCELWNKLAKENGLSGFYFISNVQSENLLEHPANKYMDANALCNMNTIFGNRTQNTILMKISKLIHFPVRIITYKKAIKYLISDKHKNNKIYPVILPNWDHSPRLGYMGTIYHNSTPELFKKLIKKAIGVIKGKPKEDQIIFIKSWNEWAEGNYLEPDLKFGKRYLEVIKEAIQESVIENPSILE